MYATLAPTPHRPSQHMPKPFPARLAVPVPPPAGLGTEHVPVMVSNGPLDEDDMHDVLDVEALLETYYLASDVTLATLNNIGRHKGWVRKRRGARGPAVPCTPSAPRTARSPDLCCLGIAWLRVHSGSTSAAQLVEAGHLDGFVLLGSPPALAKTRCRGSLPVGRSPPHAGLSAYPL